MNEIKTIITEQLGHLQLLMHRTSFHAFMHGGRAYNPHRGQGRVLACLKMKPEISQKELIYLLGMSKQSLAELLSKLEKSGYITREPSESDRRVMTVKLTEEGMKATDDAGDETSEAEKVFDCLNDGELAAFSEYLGRIIRRYEEQFPGEDFEKQRKIIEAFMAHHDHGFGGDRHGHHHGDFRDNHDRHEFAKGIYRS
jgi:DNA-binding MarR family transcriptional regulator